jgi:predicted alpha/beta-fold hydrolase
MEVFETLISNFSEFPSLDAYFQTYTLTKDFFKKISTSVTILAACDDPIIPIEDFYDIPKNKFVEVHIVDQGGHCGFIENSKRKSYYWYLMKQKMKT